MLSDYLKKMRSVTKLKTMSSIQLSMIHFFTFLELFMLLLQKNGQNILDFNGLGNINIWGTIKKTFWMSVWHIYLEI